VRVNNRCYRIGGIMKAIHEFKTECHEQGKQQKKSSGHTESLSKYFHNCVAL
jgi:hypothetical protein